MDNQRNQRPEPSNTPMRLCLYFLLSKILGPTSARIAADELAHENDVMLFGQQNDGIIGAVAHAKIAPLLSANLVLTLLPGVLLGEILSYLIPRDIKPALLSNKSLFTQLKDAHGLDFLKRQALANRFRYFIAIEGEDNQNKAEVMLQSYADPTIRAAMIVGEEMMQDAAGREFNSMSAYGYAFWSGDTRMRHMLEKYMDEASKAKALNECQRIADTGISFTFQGEVVTGSKHFDYTPLINAYEQWHIAVVPLYEPENWGDLSIWAPANQVWLKIGQEQTKVPTNLAQEYCSDISFYPNRRFNEPNLKRTLAVVTWLPKRVASCCVISLSLVREGRDTWGFASHHSDLGRSYTIYKGLRPHSIGGLSSPVHGSGQRSVNSLELDPQAIITLRRARTDNDLKQTLENLKPEEPAMRLT